MELCTTVNILMAVTTFVQHRYLFGIPFGKLYMLKIKVLTLIETRWMVQRVDINTFRMMMAICLGVNVTVIQTW